MEGGDSITQDKTIRPMIIEFDTQEEYDAFIEYTTSTEPDNSEGMRQLREMMKNHKRAKERVSAKDLRNKIGIKTTHSGKGLVELSKEGR